MITLKKLELEQALLTIAAYDKETSKLIGGLLTETLPLSAKRRLQKIHSGLLTHYKEFIEHVKELQTEFKEKEEDFQKELKILLDEVVNLDADRVSMSMIEAISTETNYNFEIIEKFAE